MTSFNYCGKKARDVGLTCRCNLSNIMPDSIFYDRGSYLLCMGWGVTAAVVVAFFHRGGNCCLPQHRRDGFSLITITPVGMGKP